MARAGNLDPLTRYRFTVYIVFENNPDFFNKLAFQRVTSPRLDIQTEEYAEGGRHLNPHSLTQGVTFTPVTMQRGKSFSNDFINWVGAVWKAFYGDKNGNTSNYRATVYIDHHDRLGNVIKKYVLENARPVSYLPASNFDAVDDSEVSIETLSISYEGFKEFSLDQQFLAGVLGTAGSDLLNRARGASGSSTTLPTGPDLIGLE